jgi:hypothetical protein
LKKKFIITAFLFLIIAACHAQDWFDAITPPAPKTPQQNTAQLFGGIAMQALGVGIIAGSAYLIVLTPEDVTYDLPLYGLTVGAGFTLAGSGLIIRSISNMVIARRAIHDMKKQNRKKDVSLLFGPTQYGVGLVCRF